MEIIADKKALKVYVNRMYFLYLLSTGSEIRKHCLILRTRKKRALRTARVLHTRHLDLTQQYQPLDTAPGASCTLQDDSIIKDSSS